jgi:L-histidine N-alpha-methyltransferase
MQTAGLNFRETSLGKFRYETVMNGRIEIYRYELEDQVVSLAHDVLLGLSSPRKYLLPKYFYDTEGSVLFDRITRTREYYPTRVEKKLLRSVVNEILSATGEIGSLVELGSGTSEKTRIFLDVLLRRNSDLRYVPVDVCGIVEQSAGELVRTYPGLVVSGIVAEYESGLQVLPYIGEKPKLLIFLGSSIGNLDDYGRSALLTAVNDALNPGDYVLIGFDLIKDRKVLHAAYNDSAGITKAFNLNLLKRVNRELGGEFDTDKFRHSAFYNEEESRIEMHLVSKTDQTVPVDSLKRNFHFSAGESIHTENSYKFSDQMISQLVASTGFAHIETWKDPDRYFALTLMRSR